MSALFCARIGRRVIVPGFLCCIVSLVSLDECGRKASVPDLEARALGLLSVPVPGLSCRGQILAILSGVSRGVSVGRRVGGGLAGLSSVVFVGLVRGDGRFLGLGGYYGFVGNGGPGRASSCPRPGFLSCLAVSILSGRDRVCTRSRGKVLTGRCSVLVMVSNTDSKGLFCKGSKLIKSALTGLGIRRGCLRVICRFLGRSRGFVSSGAANSTVPRASGKLILGLGYPVSRRLLGCSSAFGDVESSVVAGGGRVLGLRGLESALLPGLVSNRVSISGVGCSLRW